ncbi:respiratory nitrate reductase subunit gamma [Acerihabitans sp. KWT182]|uniref:nitrate reductase (quinone) n=1 Tax=Acerihabitans sp. KWT182 TaxID=3157919 RepID=A0AAU7QEY4_9GAMM
MLFLNAFFFDIYPYLAGAVFLIGSWLRYDYGQYSWRAGSSQIFDIKGMRLASNLFHIGILGIFFRPFIRHADPSLGLRAVLVHRPQTKAGHGGRGHLRFADPGGGGGLLLKRRLFNPRVRANSSVGDIAILTLLVTQVCLGLLTIPFSARHPDGSEMMKLVGWAQAVVTFHAGASAHLAGVALIYRLHLVLGMTLFLLFPFCRLVHIWSAPVEYLTRRYQLVRNRH